MTLTVNYETSTVTFAGRTFPTVGLICPDHPKFSTPNVADRTLGGPGGGAKTTQFFDAMIPCENGLLVQVTAWEDRSTLDVSLMRPQCGPYALSPDITMWIPLPVRLLSGPAALITDSHDPLGRIPPGVMNWQHADPEWVVELIDRLAKLSLKKAAVGAPLCEMVSLTRLLHLRNEQVPGYAS